MKKTLSLALALLMLVSCFAGISTEAYASGSGTRKIGSVSYDFITENGKTTITNAYAENYPTKLSIPKKIGGANVAVIQSYSFNDWTGNVKSINIPDTVEVIEDAAFSEFPKATSITIGSGVTKMTGHSFSNFPKLKKVNISEKNKKFVTVNGNIFSKNKKTLVKYMPANKASSYTVPKKVTSVAAGAFEDCKKLKTVKLPSNIKTIKSHTFSNCEKLTTGVPKQVTKIGEYAYNATSISSLKLTSKVTSIGVYAFSNCQNLKSADLSKTKITKVSEGMFASASIKTVKLPKTVKSLGEYSFAFTNLKEPVFPAKVSKLESGTFIGTKIISVKVPKRITKIGTAFQMCEELETVDLSATKLTSIPDGAFGFCSSLETVKFPKSVTKIGDGAFDFTGLKSITIPSKVTKIGSYSFAFCEKLKTVKLSSKLTTIGEGAFSSCTALKEITIPESVTSIKESTFSDSGLKTITIKGAETKINDLAFAGVEFDEETFEETYSYPEITIVAPKGSKAESFAKNNAENNVTFIAL